jgi:predicted ATPase
MRLTRFGLKGFRCYENEIWVDLDDDLTAFIGRNDVGKSALLDALNIFLNEGSPDKEDVCVSSDHPEVRIMCEFADFPEKLIVDADCPTSLQAEYLLNASGNLEIHKVFDGGLVTPKLSGTFAKAIHPTADGASDLLQLKTVELRTRVEELGLAQIEGLDRRISSNMRRVIWASIDDLRLELKEIPLDEPGAKSVWDKLRLEIPVYALFKSDRPSTDQDSEAQDPLQAAVKAAIAERLERLEAISDEILAEVSEVASRTVEKIRELDPLIAEGLNPHFAKPKWEGLFRKVSITDENQISINKRGSGVRRLILLSFFRAKVELSAEQKGQKNIIFAIEEPETSQHPDNQLMLLDALKELASTDSTQVIITTHIPQIARGLPGSSLRLIEKGDAGNRIVFSDPVEMMPRVIETLGILRDHNVGLFLFMEGEYDWIYLRKVAAMLRQEGVEVPDVAALSRDEKLIFVAQQGDNLVYHAAKMQPLNIREFHIYDRDYEPPLEPNHREQVEELNRLPNCEAVHTAKAEIENYIHPDAARIIYPQFQGEYTSFEDVPELISRAVYAEKFPEGDWSDLTGAQRRNWHKNVKRKLCWYGTDHMTAAQLQEIDPDGEVIGWLRRIGEILE